MKQILEEAACEYMSIPPVKSAIRCGEIEDLESHIKIAFKAGAEWQEEQSPWISVNDRLPENDENVFYTNCRSGALGVGYYVDNCWYQAYLGEDIYGITHWMQIPKINE